MGEEVEEYDFKTDNAELSLRRALDNMRGEVRVDPGAHHSANTVRCDALLLNRESRSDTYPTMEIDAKKVQIGTTVYLAGADKGNELKYAKELASYDDDARAVVACLKGHASGNGRVEATEGGVLYDSRDNTLTYVSRNARYQASPALALSMLAHEVESGITPRYDRSALVNDATATTSLGESVRIVDQASIDEYDPAAVTLDLSTASVVEAAGAAGWAVSTYAQPSTRIPNLTVNLTALSPEKYAAALALDVGSLITVDDWPTQAAVTSGSFFVEGYAESIGLEFHTLTLNVTDATPWLSTLILDDAVRGELDAYTLAY